MECCYLSCVVCLGSPYRVLSTRVSSRCDRFIGCCSHGCRLVAIVLSGVYTGVASTGCCYLLGVVSLESSIRCSLHGCCLYWKLLLIGCGLIAIALLCVVYTGVASTGRHPCGTHKEWIHGTTPFPPFFFCFSFIYLLA